MKYLLVIMLSICCNLLCLAQNSQAGKDSAMIKIKAFDSLWRASHMHTFSDNKSSDISDLSVYNHSDAVKDSSEAENYNESSYLLSAYLLMHNTDIKFKKPDWYKGNIEKSIYALILLDDQGFCEEFHIMKGIDSQIDDYVRESFINMPRLMFMRWEEANPPKSKIAVKKKIIPLVISFVSETSAAE